MTDMYQFDEDFSVTDGAVATAKIFFQVVIDYNHELLKSIVSEENADNLDGDGALESNPLETYDEADEMAKDTVGQIHAKFPGSSVTELEPEDQEDEYHIRVFSEAGEEIARIGVIAIDYSNATIH